MIRKLDGVCAYSMSHPLPISVLIPTRNEFSNLRRCLAPLIGWAREVVVADSQSSDGTAEHALSVGANVIQFHYTGGWPKKRQWALETYPWQGDWILLLDADEILSEQVKAAIERAILSPGTADGFRLCFRVVFLGRMLKHGDTALWKLSLFRRGKGNFERRLAEQDPTMSDIEVHEHVVVDGSVGEISTPVRHENVNSLHRYITKHNEYSTWEAAVFLSGEQTTIRPSLLGSQAQRRRWLKTRLLMMPGSPLLRFLYVYVVRLGFLDGRAGLAYATFKFVQTCHVKLKILESRLNASRQAGRVSAAGATRVRMMNASH